MKVCLLMCLIFVESVAYSKLQACLPPVLGRGTRFWPRYCLVCGISTRRRGFEFKGLGDLLVRIRNGKMYEVAYVLTDNRQVYCKMDR